MRLGDPEAQVILPLIDEPLVPMLAAAAAGSLTQSSCRLSAEKLVGVVLASKGYPDSSESGRPISGIASAERVPGVTVLHAGTADRDGQLVTAGGRVLTVVGRGPDFSARSATPTPGSRRSRSTACSIGRTSGERRSRRLVTPTQRTGHTGSVERSLP